MVASGADHETVTLASLGESALQGDSPVAEGPAISGTIKTAAGKSGQARFKM
jgi:hypothetical protein